jgi:hypothetical protein
VSEVVTLELPADLVRQARELAAASGRRLDDAVAEWVGRAVAEVPVEALPDAHVLALCDGQLPAADRACRGLAPPVPVLVPVRTPDTDHATTDLACGMIVY